MTPSPTPVPWRVSILAGCGGNPVADLSQLLRVAPVLQRWDRRPRKGLPKQEAGAGGPEGGLLPCACPLSFPVLSRCLANTLGWVMQGQGSRVSPWVSRWEERRWASSLPRGFTRDRWKRPLEAPRPPARLWPQSPNPRSGWVEKGSWTEPPLMVPRKAHQPLAPSPLFLLHQPWPVWATVMPGGSGAPRPGSSLSSQLEGAVWRAGAREARLPKPRVNSSQPRARLGARAWEVHWGFPERPRADAWHRDPASQPAPTGGAPSPGRPLLADARPPSSCARLPVSGFLRSSVACPGLPAGLRGLHQSAAGLRYPRPSRLRSPRARVSSGLGPVLHSMASADHQLCCYYIPLLVVRGKEASGRPWDPLEPGPGAAVLIVPSVPAAPPAVNLLHGSPGHIPKPSCNWRPLEPPLFLPG